MKTNAAMKTNTTRRILSTLLLMLLALALCLPFAAMTESTPQSTNTDSTVVLAPSNDADPSDGSTPASDTTPAAGYDWASLASVAGATAFTLLVVQFIKAPLDKLWHIPTRIVVYVIALATLLLAQVFTAGFTVEGVALAAVNAVIAASAAMGAYEVTFANTEKQKE